jgi:hypothetical protein
MVLSERLNVAAEGACAVADSVAAYNPAKRGNDFEHAAKHTTEPEPCLLSSCHSVRLSSKKTPTLT